LTPENAELLAKYADQLVTGLGGGFRDEIG